MSLSDSLKLVDDLIASKSDALSKAVLGATTRSKASADGKLQQDTEKRTVNPALDHVNSNPIINMGVDTVNQAVTKISQQLVVTGAKKLEAAVNKTLGIPLRKTIQDATDAFFMTTALVTTAQTEVVMELARVTARQIVKLIDQKDAVAKELKSNIKQLYNAINILLNSQPFFDAYLRQLQRAYTLTDLGNKGMKSVVRSLKSVHRYQQTLFDSSLNQLVQARDLILPDRNASVSEITSVDFLSDTIKRKSNKDAVAAAMAIPGLSYKVGQTLLKYLQYTIQINGLLVIFQNYLSDYISTFKRNDNVDSATINHITSATNQLDTLLADMKVMLFPNDGSDQSVLYPGRVTTAATGWGIRLTTIIEWLRIQPGKASKELDLTSESVRKYNAALDSLRILNDRRNGLAVLKVKEAKEDTIDFAKTVGKLLIVANTAVATSKAPSDIRLRFKQMNDTIDLALTNDFLIKSALYQFINTDLALIGAASRIVKTLTKLADDLGLDKAADTLRKGDLKSLYSMNSETATYAGAAAVAVGTVIGLLKTKPEVTDSELNKLENVRDTYNQENSVKKVEAQRSSSATSDVYIAEQEVNIERQRAEANSAGDVIKKRDPENTRGPMEIAQEAISKAGSGTSSLGGILKDKLPGVGSIFGGSGNV